MFRITLPFSNYQLATMLNRILGPANIVVTKVGKFAGAYIIRVWERTGNKCLMTINAPRRETGKVTQRRRELLFYITL